MTLQEALVGGDTIKKMASAINSAREGKKFPSFDKVLEKLKEEYPSLATMLDQKPRSSDRGISQQQRDKMEQLEDIYKQAKQGKIDLERYR